MTDKDYIPVQFVQNYIKKLQKENWCYGQDYLLWYADKDLVNCRQTSEHITALENLLDAWEKENKTDD